MTSLNIQAVRDLYNSGTVTPRELISGIYDRIESQPLHPVWISLIPREQAMEQAANVNVTLPLAGDPFCGQGQH